MRQLFLSQYKHRVNPILLTYLNNHHRFTFLQTDINSLLNNQSSHTTINNHSTISNNNHSTILNNNLQSNNLMKSIQIDSFLQTTNKYKQQLTKAYQHDFTETQLEPIWVSMKIKQQRKKEVANNVYKFGQNQNDQTGEHNKKKLTKTKENSKKAQKTATKNSTDTIKNNESLFTTRNALRHCQQQPVIEKNTNSIWTMENAFMLQQLAQKYQLITDSMYEKLTKQNLSASILTLTQFNCIEMRVWQRLIAFISSYYKVSSLDERLVMVTAMSEYLKKFQFLIDNNANDNVGHNNYSNNTSVTTNTKTIAFSSNNSRNFNGNINNNNRNSRNSNNNGNNKYQQQQQSTLIRKPAFKFMYPQSYIIDLVDFREIFKSLQFEGDIVRVQDSEQEQRKKLLILQNLIYLIVKSTKKADMNIYAVRDYFERRKDEMVWIFENYKLSEVHGRVMYNIYFIYSYLNFNDGQWFERIERPYYQMLRERMGSVNGHILQRSGPTNSKSEADINVTQSDINQNSDNGNNNTASVTTTQRQQTIKEQLPKRLDYKQLHLQSRQVNRLLSIWKLNQRSSTTIYDELIYPLLNLIIARKFQVKYYSNYAINMLAAGITDYELFKKMIQILQLQNVKDDEFIHMLKHYLNVKQQGLIHKSDYHKCTRYQHPSILYHIKKHCPEVFSECLKSQHNHEIHPFGNYSWKKHKSSEHHRTQRIWSDIVNSLIIGTKHQLIQNANICNYEIDFLILTEKKMFAIQIEGGHYNKKEFNDRQSIGQKERDNNITESRVVKSTGKREVREMILRAYNIEIVKIHCEEKVPTYIMQSKNVSAGKKYIEEKILAQTSVKWQDVV